MVLNHYSPVVLHYNSLEIVVNNVNIKIAMDLFLGMHSFINFCLLYTVL